MSDFENLEKFNLLGHGDYYEKKWWSLLSKDFPAYETFWRRYIVPITNRVDSNISRGSDAWLAIRQDVSPQYEKMAMAHYSIFYYFARATEMVNSERYFTEDAFHLLDSCVDNIELFFGSIGAIVKDLGGSAEFLPKQHPKDYPPVFSEIHKYRDVMLHNPVHGRLIKDGVEFLPKPTDLEAFRWSWRGLANLTDHDFVHSGNMLKHLRLALGQYLQDTWVKIIAEMDKLRDKDKLKKVLKLEGLLPICEPCGPIGLDQPHAASGTIISVVPASPQVRTLTLTRTDEQVTETTSTAGHRGPTIAKGIG